MAQRLRRIAYRHVVSADHGAINGNERDVKFWIKITSAETTTTTAFDTLRVQMRNSSNTVLSTLATYSNLNKSTG